MVIKATAKFIIFMANLKRIAATTPSEGIIGTQMVRNTGGVVRAIVTNWGRLFLFVP